MAQNTGFASKFFPYSNSREYRPRVEHRDGPFVIGPFPHEERAAVSRLLSSATPLTRAKLRTTLAHARRN